MKIFKIYGSKIIYFLARGPLTGDRSNKFPMSVVTENSLDHDRSFDGLFDRSFLTGLFDPTVVRMGVKNFLFLRDGNMR